MSAVVLESPVLGIHHSPMAHLQFNPNTLPDQQNESRSGESGTDYNFFQSMSRLTPVLFFFQVPRTSSASRRLQQRCRPKVAVHASTVVPRIHLSGDATQTATLYATLVVSHHLSLIGVPCPLYALSLFLSRLGRAMRERNCRHVALTRGDIWCW